MAKYPQGITSFIPTYQPFQLDWNILAKNVQLKQTKYDQNWQGLNNVYSSLYNAAVSNPNSQDVKDNLLKQIDFNVKRVTGMDLSLKQNVTQAQQIFKPFYQNTNLMSDIVKTSQYNSEIAKADSFATSKNKEEYEMYWGGGKQYLNNKMEEFKALPFDKISSFEKFEYVPYVNTDKVMREIQKEMGNVKVMRKNGSYWVTTQNGELLKEPLQRRFRQALQSDPRVMDVYRVEAYNMGKTNVRSKMTENSNLSQEEAERLYVNEELSAIRDLQQKDYDKIESEKQIVQNKIKDLEITSKNNPTESATKSLEEYRAYLNSLDQIEKSAKANLELINGNVNKTATTEGGAPVDPNDIKRLQYGLNSNLASVLLNQDINATAQEMAKANYEQTFKVDELAKINYSKRLELDNYQKKKYIDASAKAGYFPMLFKDKNGNPIYIPWADQNKIKTEKAAKKSAAAELAKKLKTGEYENTPNGPQPTANKNFVQLKPVKGATVSNLSSEELNKQMQIVIDDEKASINNKMTSIHSVLKTMLQDGSTTTEEINNILGSHLNNRQDQQIYDKIYNRYRSGEIDKKTAFDLYRAQTAGFYQTAVDKANPKKGDRSFRAQSKERQIEIINSKLNSDNTALDPFELELIIDNYRNFVKQNEDLKIMQSSQLKNNEIFNLGYDLEDFHENKDAVNLANQKLSDESTALLIKFGKEVGGNMSDRAHLMQTFSPVTGWRTSTFEEYARGTVAMYSPEKVESSNNFTLEGFWTNFAKGSALGAISGSGLEALNIFPGAGLAAHTAWAAGVGLVTALTPAVIETAEDIYYNDGTDLGELYIEGMNKQKVMDAGYGSETLVTFLGRGNNLRHEYNDYLKEVNRLYEDQELKTRIPGTQNFIDQVALASGSSQTIMGVPSISVDEDMPTTLNYQMFLSDMKPTLKDVEVNYTRDLGMFKGEKFNNVSVYGVSNADYESSTEKYGEEQLAKLANLMLTDVSSFPSKDEDFILKEFDVAISPLSKDGNDQAAIILKTNEKYLDKILKQVYPDKDDSELIELLKVDILSKDQGLAINVPVEKVKNTELYKNQFKGPMVRRILDAKGEPVIYNSINPNFAISFANVNNDIDGLIKVIKYFPLYNPFTQETIIQSIEVEDLLLGRQVKELRNFWENTEVPKMMELNNANYQKPKGKTQTQN
tara:strand:+ start:1509 stop:5039 length:3531 start_codon:yes stop_codon:yes gene_type:complete